MKAYTKWDFVKEFPRLSAIVVVLFIALLLAIARLFTV